MLQNFGNQASPKNCFSKDFLSLPDRSVITSGATVFRDTSDNTTSLVSAASAARKHTNLFPKIISNETNEEITLTQLQALLEDAPCGKKDQTVLDTKVRKTKRVADLSKIRIEWVEKKSSASKKSKKEGKKENTNSEDTTTLTTPVTADAEAKTTNANSNNNNTNDNNKDAGLYEITAKVEQQLLRTPNMLVNKRIVKAELHSVLVYEKGDFFALHRDSKKAPNHELTLSVNCEIPGTSQKKISGGFLRFPLAEVTNTSTNTGLQESDDEVELLKLLNEDDDYDDSNDSDDDEEETAVNKKKKSSKGGSKKDSKYKSFPASPSGLNNGGLWTETTNGSWAAWFATEPHQVEKLYNGTRIALTYNLMTQEIPEEEQQDQQKCHNMILSPSSSLAKTSLKILRDTIVRNKTQQLIPSTKTQIGVILCHQYSTDGAEEVPRSYIRGRDALLVKALEDGSLFSINNNNSNTSNNSRKKIKVRFIPVSLVVEQPRYDKATVSALFQKLFIGSWNGTTNSFECASQQPQHSMVSAAQKAILDLVEQEVFPVIREQTQQEIIDENKAKAAKTAVPSSTQNPAGQSLLRTNPILGSLFSNSLPNSGARASPNTFPVLPIQFLHGFGPAPDKDSYATATTCVDNGRGYDLDEHYKKTKVDYNSASARAQRLERNCSSSDLYVNAASARKITVDFVHSTKTNSPSDEEDKNKNEDAAATTTTTTTTMTRKLPTADEKQQFMQELNKQLENLRRGSLLHFNEEYNSATNPSISKTGKWMGGEELPNLLFDESQVVAVSNLRNLQRGSVGTTVAATSNNLAASQNQDASEHNKELDVSDMMSAILSGSSSNDDASGSVSNEDSAIVSPTTTTTNTAAENNNTMMNTNNNKTVVAAVSEEDDEQETNNKNSENNDVPPLVCKNQENPLELSQAAGTKHLPLPVSAHFVSATTKVRFNPGDIAETNKSPTDSAGGGAAAGDKKKKPDVSEEKFYTTTFQEEQSEGLRVNFPQGHPLRVDSCDEQQFPATMNQIEALNQRHLQGLETQFFYSNDGDAQIAAKPLRNIELSNGVGVFIRSAGLINPHSCAGGGGGDSSEEGRSGEILWGNDEMFVQYWLKTTLAVVELEDVLPSRNRNNNKATGVRREREEEEENKTA